MLFPCSFSFFEGRGGAVGRYKEDKSFDYSRVRAVKVNLWLRYRELTANYKDQSHFIGHKQSSKTMFICVK